MTPHDQFLVELKLEPENELVNNVLISSLINLHTLFFLLSTYIFCNQD